jgi:ribosomal protein S18 acetylase RimI-like enzyme
LVIRSALDHDLDSYVDVLATAFPDKFAIIFRDRAEAGKRALRDFLDPLGETGGHHVAECDGRVAGIMHLAMAGEDEGGWSGSVPFIRRLGPARGVRALMAFGLLSKKVEEDESYISHIAVHPDFRGRGVGRGLMAEAERLSREGGKDRITLYVASDNASAKGLYLACGFHTVRTEQSDLALMLLGKGQWELMQKDLAGMPD